MAVRRGGFPCPSKATKSRSGSVKSVISKLTRERPSPRPASTSWNTRSPTWATTRPNRFSWRQAQITLSKFGTLRRCFIVNPRNPSSGYLTIMSQWALFRQSFLHLQLHFQILYHKILKSKTAALSSANLLFFDLKDTLLYYLLGISPLSFRLYTISPNLW